MLLRTKKTAISLACSLSPLTSVSTASSSAVRVVFVVVFVVVVVVTTSATSSRREMGMDSSRGLVVNVVGSGTIV